MTSSGRANAAARVTIDGILMSAAIDSSSAVGEFCGAFLNKRRHAFLLPFGGERRVEHPPLVANALGEAGLEGTIDALLGEEHGGPRQRRNVLRCGDRLVDQRLGRNDARDEAHSFCLFGVDHPAGEDHVHRLRLANQARQSLRGAGARQDPDGDLGLAKARRLGGKDEVAHQRQLASSAQSVARHRGDDRFAAARDPLPR